MWSKAGALTTGSDVLEVGHVIDQLQNRLPSMRLSPPVRERSPELHRE
jgi:hypothetical protein